MFWRFGSYANISAIETLLDKPDVTLEELLDEADLLQELKTHNSKLIEFLRDENRLGRLLEYVIDPKATYANENASADDLDEPSFGSSFGRSSSSFQASRESDESRRARLACEILSSGTWSLAEAALENMDHLRRFWSFLERDAPLDPVQAAYFTKVNETLLDKKPEEMLAFFTSLDNIVPTMLKHVECPMIMDLLLKIISMEKAENAIGIVDWLQSKNLIPILLSFLSPDHSTTMQTSTGDFLKAIITISANASQHEQSCIGPNDLTRQLVSEPCINTLIQDMLKGGNPLTVGVGIIIEVIRKNNSDYDPENATGVDQPPSSRDPIYLGTLLRLFAKHVPDFMNLIMNQNEVVVQADGTKIERPRELRAAYGGIIEPLGFNRFKTCELMAELLHCSNMGLLNERGSEAYIQERDKERERLKKLREKAREAQKEAGYSADLGGFRYMGVMGEKGPLEVQNADDNSSEATTEDDGFEDVSAEGLGLDDDGKGGSSAAARRVTDPFLKDDEDMELVAEDEPDTPKALPTKPQTGEPEDFSMGEPSQPLVGSGMQKQTDSNPVSVITIAPPSADAPPPPDPTGDVAVGNVASALEKVQIKEPEKVKDLPPLPPQTSKEEAQIESGSSTPTAEKPESTASAEKAPSGTESKPEVGAATSSTADSSSQPTIPAQKSGTPPPPYEEVDTQATPTTPVVLNKPSDASKQPPPERLNADLPPLPMDASAKTSSNEGPSSTTASPGGEDPSPFSDSAAFEGGADSIDDSRDDMSIGSYKYVVEPDIDGRPVVGDYLKMQFVEHKVVVTILEFFFRFPWNNFLHNVVYDVVQQVFNGPIDRGYNRMLALDLFATGRITEKIVEGQRFSDETQRKTRMRMGYMGHLTLIAEEVVKFTDKFPPEVLGPDVIDMVMNPDWIDYVENILVETRERDNAILGGFRPDQSLGPRAFGTAAAVAALPLALSIGNSAGSNSGADGSSGFGNDAIIGGGGSTSFGSGAGALGSGFGSSSDEEEDDRDDYDDDIDAARRSGGGGGGDLGGSGGGLADSAAAAAASGLAGGSAAANDQVGDILFDDDIDPEDVDENLIAKYFPIFEE